MSHPIETGNPWVDGLTIREVRHALADILSAVEGGKWAVFAAVIYRIEKQASGEPV